MPLTSSQRMQLQNFFHQSRFDECGAVITDLDGTAIHEFQGRYSIPQSVELGLSKIYELGRPVILNTLRFPLSVIRTFGKEWYKISNAAIPTVLMNGSQLGFIHQNEHGDFYFEEIDAFPLLEKELVIPLKIVEDLLKKNINDLLVFFYPRDWHLGEIIWTPAADKIPAIQKKYLSVSRVFASGLPGLKNELLKQEICMIFLLLNIPEDELMAYQHTKRNNFFTHEAVDKESGVQEIARRLGIELKHSIGAGDSEMDSFLRSVGLSVHVGNPFLNYEGIVPPIRVSNSSEFGELLFELAALQRNVLQ